MISIPPSSPLASVAAPPRDAALMEAAQNLEAALLAEMLQSAGLGKTSESFGGGAGVQLRHVSMRVYRKKRR